MVTGLLLELDPLHGPIRPAGSAFAMRLRWSPRRLPRLVAGSGVVGAVSPWAFSLVVSLTDVSPLLSALPDMASKPGGADASKLCRRGRSRCRQPTDAGHSLRTKWRDADSGLLEVFEGAA